MCKNMDKYEVIKFLRQETLKIGLERKNEEINEIMAFSTKLIIFYCSQVEKKL